MLRDGKYIKEPLPKIGVYYIPPQRSEITPEEQFAQNMLLETKRDKHPILRKVIDFMVNP